ncbi:hypothetical protein TVAG_186510 [Trichomonas vaginalis G3]|uniref:Polycystin cation channel PKD1/PKD2 domain-containing protein n=1 Tax=Trichomonas vaginalis (strain ATCC PRA-98 / G3) TaxID=412133 RepID=A2D8U4_TRIV3|nr:mucolipin family [Trichomonas vaginalis G3]EAY23343.1 hypothetical protein TVAG_186510 [Trichomonas vaginalis G3]KAI5533804.1 mucolipin family [Trichomonas vaginalis G3]|eukprot:XP_001584329.1 hypothetical protein [Trichomonas vaginalis G3]
MALRIRFVRRVPKPRRKKESPFLQVSETELWHKTYIPPWEMFYNILESIILIIFFFTVANPVIYYYYLQRGAFVDSFYPKQDEGTPIEDFSIISDYYDTVNESYYTLKTDSFLEIHDVNRSLPVLCEIYWMNGSKTEGSFPDIDLEFFKHINRIIISLDYVIVSSDLTYPGCSNWYTQTEIAARDGLVQFTIEPSIRRKSCTPEMMTEFNVTTPKSIAVTDDNSHRMLQSIREQSIKAPLQFSRGRTKNKLTKKSKKNAHPLIKRNRPHISEERKYRNNHLLKNKNTKTTILYDNKFKLEECKVFRITNHLMLCIVVADALHIFTMLFSLRNRYNLHKNRLSNNQYRNMASLPRIHITIGYWFIIDFVCSCITLILASITFANSYKMTQFPSQITLEIISFAGLFSIIRLSQWLKFSNGLYQLITIIREAAIMLLNLAVEVIPIWSAFILFGIFTFGLISDSFRTVRELVERFITSGMGDSIDDFYIVIDDGTDATAWLSFFYVSAITAGGMWIIFTSCISSIMYVREHYVDLD